MKTVAVIPARLASTRFPGKVLMDLAGKPVLWHVWRRTRLAKDVAETYVATDSPAIVDAVRSWGGRVIMTESTCRSGTDRIASVIHGLDADYILNVQGDEPLVRPELLQQLIRAAKDRQCDVFTPIYRLRRGEDLTSPHVVKVATAADGRALYFSRSPIPHLRDVSAHDWLASGATFWGHVGIYGYRRDVLEAYARMPLGSLEQCEKLEQLRLLESGLEIGTVETNFPSIGIDVPDDLKRVRELVALEQGVLLVDSVSPTIINEPDETQRVMRSDGFPIGVAMPKAWGETTSLIEDDRFHIDHILVRRGGYCSLHKHGMKENLFVVLQGTLQVDCHDGDSRQTLVLTPDSIPCRVPAGVLHRFTGIAPHTNALEIYTPVPGRGLDRHDIVRQDAGGQWDEWCADEMHVSEQEVR